MGGRAFLRHVSRTAPARSRDARPAPAGAPGPATCRATGSALNAWDGRMSEVDDGRRRRAAAERQKRARTREALGLVVLPIELHEAQIADALIEARLLTEDETADRGRVAEAVAEVVAEVVAEWAGGKLSSRVTVAAGADQVSSAYENCDPRPR